MKRPDSVAVVGLLVAAALIAVAGLALIAAGHDVPAEVWAIVAASLGAVGGWIGKTVVSEPPPAPEIVAPPARPIEHIDPRPPTPAVYPLPTVDADPGTPDTPDPLTRTH